MRILRNRFFVAVLCSLFGVFLTAECHALSAVDIFRVNSPGVATLRVTTKEGRVSQGTGFLISPRGELLTNFHVIKDADSIEVNFSEHFRYSARRIVAQDPGRDVALIWVEDVSPTITPLRLSNTKLPEGSDLVVIGTPRGFEKTVTTGILSGYRNFGQVSFIQFTAPISRGSSGSPVFSMSGTVIGIAIGTMQDAQGVNFALDANGISDFLRTRPFITPVSQTQTNNRNQLSTANIDAAPQSRFAAADFSGILTRLQQLTPGQPMSRARQTLGPPDREAMDGMRTDTWYFRDNNAMLTVWYNNNGAVSRSTWVEYYVSKTEAESRLESLWNSAARSLGRHNSASQNSRIWNQRGHVMSIEHHSRQGTNMVLFTVR